MRRIAIVFAWTVLLAPGQTGAAGAMAFEVASVRIAAPQSRPESTGGPGTSDPARYCYYSADLADLITTAYHVDYFQIASKVPLEQNHFDVVAKVPEGATREQFRAMLRNLLADRFHLRASVELREYPGYELAIAKGGPKLPGTAGAASSRRNSAESEFPQLPANRPGLRSQHRVIGGNVLVRMRARRQSMAVFADWLQPPDGRPVVDKTGLAGTYDFTFEYAETLRGSPGDLLAEPSALPDLFAALQQQLGLHLVSRKIPFPTVVVESVDPLPVEND